MRLKIWRGMICIIVNKEDNITRIRRNVYRRLVRERKFDQVFISIFIPVSYTHLTLPTICSV